MSEPEVSILMPVYNAADTLPAAARSLASQTLDNWECLLVDDGSSDATLDVARELAAQDPRFIAVPRRREGLVPALNAGLALCRAPLVARMDADDIALPARLEAQAGLLNGDKRLALAGCLVRCFAENGEPVPEGMALYEQWINTLVTHEQIVRDLFVESPFAHPSVMFRRDAVLAAGGYLDRGWPEDYDLWMRLWMSGARFAKCPETLLEWRDTPGRLSRTHNAYSLMNFRRLKMYYLLLTHLKERREVTLWGAGRGGRWWCSELLRSGVAVKCFIDIDPRKIGRRVGSIPILPPDALAGRDGPFILSVVESRGARDLIRRKLLEMNYSELEDFLFLA